MRETCLRSRPFLLLLFLFALLGNSGCVERRLLIRSDPDEAFVYVDDERIGKTPIEVPFIHYGTRRIVLEKEDHQPLVVTETIRAPWYQIFPLEIFFDLLYPATLRDHRLLTYRLEPNQPKSLDEQDVQDLKRRSDTLEKTLEERLESD